MRRDLDQSGRGELGAFPLCDEEGTYPPCRSLSPDEHGTRFLGVLRDRLQPTLRHLPAGFTLDFYFDGQGRMSLPIARGLVSWVRKVGAHGRIEFSGAEYPVSRKLEHQYVTAMLFTHHRRVFIKHEGKLIKSFPFPSPEKSSSLSAEGQTVCDVLTVLIIKNQFAILLRLPATDMVAANAMGIETKEIPTFEWAQKADMKPLGLDEIEVRGEKLDQVRRIFVRPNVIPWNRISGVWGNKEI